MKKIIKLSELDHISSDSEYANRYYLIPLDFYEKARKILSEQNLRFNNKTGEMWRGKERVERYVIQSDFVPLNSIEEVMRWNFSRFINNSAQRLQNGYKA